MHLVTWAAVEAHTSLPRSRKLWLPPAPPRSSMAQRTLGDAGSNLVSLSYAGLHYALLVACAR